MVHQLYLLFELFTLKDGPYLFKGVASHGNQVKKFIGEFPNLQQRQSGIWVGAPNIIVRNKTTLLSVTITMITSTRSFSSSSTEMDPVSFFAVILFNASLQSYALKHWASLQNLLTLSFTSNNISSFKHGYETNLPDLKEYFLSSK